MSAILNKKINTFLNIKPEGIGNLSGNYPFLYPTNNSMIPVFAIDIIQPSIYYGDRYISKFCPIRGDLYHKLNATDIPTRLTQALLRKINNKEETRINSIAQLAHIINIVKNRLIDTELNSKLNINSLQFHGGRITNYRNMFNTLQIHGWRKVNLRSSSYIVNVDSVFAIRHTNTGNKVIVPLFCLMINREYVEYYKLCFITGKEPDSRIFEMWINPEFDVVRSEFKLFRTQYRKYYKPSLEKSGIPIIEVEDMFDKLFICNKVPNFSTIKEKKEYDKSISDEFLNNLKKINELNAESIQLTV